MYTRAVSRASCYARHTRASVRTWSRARICAGVSARSGNRDYNFTDHFPRTRNSPENYKATGRSASSATAVYAHLRPLFSRTCAHTRPRDTRGFRYTGLLRRMHAEATAGEGCFAITVISRDVEARGSRDAIVTFDNDSFSAFKRHSRKYRACF